MEPDHTEFDNAMYELLRLEDLTECTDAKRMQISLLNMSELSRLLSMRTIYQSGNGEYAIYRCNASVNGFNRCYRTVYTILELELCSHCSDWCCLGCKDYYKERFDSDVIMCPDCKEAVMCGTETEPCTRVPEEKTLSPPASDWY